MMARFLIQFLSLSGPFSPQRGTAGKVKIKIAAAIMNASWPIQSLG